jgi:hypothetical protein
MKNNMLSQWHLANISITNYKFFGMYIGLVILLAFSLLAAVKVKEMQRLQRRKKEMSKINSHIDQVIGNEPGQKKAG